MCDDAIMMAGDDRDDGHEIHAGGFGGDGGAATGLTVTFDIVPRLSLAFHQNGVPPVGGIEIRNRGVADLEDLKVRVVADPPFLAGASVQVSRLRAGTTMAVPATGITMDAPHFRDVTEAVRGSVTCLVEDRNGHELARATHPCDLLAPNEWTGIAHAPELVAAFVLPNDPAVDVINRAASAKLQASGRNPALDGYASGQRERVWECIEALWGAVSDLQVSYALPPAGFERDGQKVRLPGDVVRARVGTCLDTTLLFAACLEQMRLDPVVVLFEGHALVGAWLAPTDLTEAKVLEPQVLRKRVALGELILVETTLVTTRTAGQAAITFAQACDVAKDEVTEGSARAFEVAIDIRRVRDQRIRPLSLGADGAVVADTGDASPYVLGAAPDLSPAAPLPSGISAGQDPRIEVWKRRLLDLSLRNKLLNFKPGKQTIEFYCPDAAAAEDRLAIGNGLRIVPAPAPIVLPSSAPRDDGQGVGATRGRREAIAIDLDAVARESLQRDEIVARAVGEDLAARLIELYRAVRTSLEETGASTLFLVFGFVSWTARASATRAAVRPGPYRAPLLLLPVSLERRSMRADGFTIKGTDEPARINPTFLEMVRQDFGVDIPDIDPNSVTDDAGINVRRIWAHVRTSLRNVEGFELTEEVALSTFSFAKYLMWKQLGEQAEALMQSPVVRRLVSRAGAMAPMDGPEGLDARVPAGRLRLPLEADSSQVAAIEAATRGRDFVLFGPPGTGKSQTITNLIAHLLGEGKTVLFVSQKATALDVVHRRLKSLGLDPFCLELHSAKAQKSAVFQQLQRAWEFANDDAVNAYAPTAAALGPVRDRLNVYVEALHRAWPNGMSVFGALGRILAGRDLAPNVTLPPGRPDADTTAKADARDQAAIGVASWIGKVGDPRVHPLRVVTRTPWLAPWQANVRDASTRLADASRKARPAADGVANLLGQAHTGSPVSISRRLATATPLVDHLRLPEASDGCRFLDADRPGILRAIAGATDARNAATRSRDRLVLAYRDSVWQVDLEAAIAGWEQADRSIFFLRWFRTGPAWQVVGAHATTDRNEGRRPPDPMAELRALRELARLRADAEAAEVVLASTYGVTVDAAPSVRVAAAWADRALELARAAGVGSDDLPRAAWIEEAVRREASGGDDTPGAILDAGRAAMADLIEARRGFEAIAGAATDWAGLDTGDRWLASAEAVATEVGANAHDLRTWCDWLSACAAAREAGIWPVVEALVGGVIAPGQASDLARVAHARGWAEAAVGAESALLRFRGLNHQQLIDRFRELDATLTTAAIVETRERLARAVPRRGDVGDHPQWLTLSRQLVRQRGQMPVRKVIEELPDVVRVLAPCLMMSPISIAQYLPARHAIFDVVIFDEASQLPTWDAVGAIARGKQAVIAGDPKQLPPTNFFDRADDDGDGDEVLEEEESVLDACLGVNVPQSNLRWHYRSRHESLIAFSNERYYEGKLITFPSPVTTDRAVRLMAVPRGVYDRGNTRTNRAEADAVVADVVRRLEEAVSTSGRASIGVVTFNSEQQRLIDDLLEGVRGTRPDLERYFGAASEEPVFVKNLETVQGDERDVILFSIGYGPDASGKVYMNFGPLNRRGGSRRLNVAITRARRELAVFATLRADQMTLSPTTPDGVRDFKHFLEYADRGPDALVRAAGSPTGAVESPFEQAVKGLIEAKGWTLHPQVGVSGYRIDLGVVHPDAPGRYLAGIECDGATYHRSATARDRDRLRENVLSELGWQIVRVWSPDWWANAAHEAQVLDDRLSALLEEDRRRVSVAPKRTEGNGGVEAAGVLDRSGTVDQDVPPMLTEPSLRQGYAGQVAPPSPPVSAPLQPTAPLPVFAPYVVTDFRQAGIGANAGAFHEDWYRPTIRRMVAHVIATEGPVYDATVVERVRVAHGLGRAGRLIRDVVLGAVLAEVRRVVEADGRTVYFLPSVDLARVAFRQSERSVRDVDAIPVMELAGLARVLDVGNRFDDDAVTAMRDALGVGRVGAPMRERLLEAIRLARRSP